MWSKRGAENKNTAEWKGAALLFWLLSILLLRRLERKDDRDTIQMKRNRKIKTEHWKRYRKWEQNYSQPHLFQEEKKAKKRQIQKDLEPHTDHIIQMSDMNLQGKKEGNRKGWIGTLSSESSKSNSYQKHLPAASALAAIPLCALQERCLKSAQHQPEIVYGRQKAELSSQHLYALNAPEKTKKHPICPTGRESNAQSSIRCGTGRWDPRRKNNNI